MKAKIFLIGLLLLSVFIVGCTNNVSRDSFVCEEMYGDLFHAHQTTHYGSTEDKHTLCCSSYNVGTRSHDRCYLININDVGVDDK